MICELQCAINNVPMKQGNNIIPPREMEFPGISSALTLNIPEQNLLEQVQRKPQGSSEGWSQDGELGIFHLENRRS